MYYERLMASHAAEGPACLPPSYSSRRRLPICVEVQTPCCRLLATSLSHDDLITKKRGGTAVAVDDGEEEEGEAALSRAGGGSGWSCGSGGPLLLLS